MDLTDQEVRDLRRRALAGQGQPGNKVPARFQDGPLDGMTLAIRDDTSLFIAWVVPRASGPVSVFYRRREGVYRFDGIKPVSG